MPIVSNDQLKTYIQEYLGQIELIKSLFTEENLKYFFPKFMYSPFRIEATISDVSGVAIEFIEPSDIYNIEVVRRHIRIQDAVLPRTAKRGIPILQLQSSKYVRMENFTLSTQRKGQFVTIDNESDIEFLNVRFEMRHPDKTLTKEVLDLRLFGSNSAQDWSKDCAKQRFYEDFNHYLSKPLGQAIAIVRELLALPKSVSKEDTLVSYERVLDVYERLLKYATAESELQEFFKKNPIVLEPCAEWIKPKYNIDSQYIPDFVIKQANNYVLVEIEGPTDKLYIQSSGNQRAESAVLRQAIVQTEEWQGWIRDHLSAARERLPGISSPEAWVLIGRKSSLDVKDLRRLRESNETSRGKRIVKTYDDLLERGRVYLSNLRKLY